MSHGPMLGLIETAGTEILTLVGELEEREFFESRLTRAEVVKRLRRIAATAELLAPPLRQAMPEIDWAAWASLERSLAAGTAEPCAVWAAIRELTPLTLQWLRVYEQSDLPLFGMAS